MNRAVEETVSFHANPTLHRFSEFSQQNSIQAQDQVSSAQPCYLLPSSPPLLEPWGPCGRWTHRGQLSRQQVAILGQHVGHHDGWEVHSLVRVGREQPVGRKAVAQRVVAGFVVPQVQEGWLREVGRRYRRNLIVFIALALAAVGLKTSEGRGQG